MLGVTPKGLIHILLQKLLNPILTRLFHMIYYHGDESYPYLVRIGFRVYSRESRKSREWTIHSIHASLEGVLKFEIHTQYDFIQIFGQT